MIDILKKLQKQIDIRRVFATNLINLKDDEQDILRGWSLNINDLENTIELVKPKLIPEEENITFTFNGDKFKFKSYKGKMKSFKSFRQGANWAEGFENGIKGDPNCDICNGLGKIRTLKNDINFRNYQILICNCTKKIKRFT
jgi:hypothetical protein